MQQHIRMKNNLKTIECGREEIYWREGEVAKVAIKKFILIIREQQHKKTIFHHTIINGIVLKDFLFTFSFLPSHT